MLRGLAINPARASIVQGTTLRLAAIGLYSDGSQQDLSTTATWTTADVIGTDVAPVAAGGLVLGRNIGSAQVRATAGGYSATAAVSVIAVTYSGIVVTPAFTAGPDAGGTIQFTATATLTDGTTEDVSSLATWTVDNLYGVVTVDSNGLATVESVGFVIITATFAGFSDIGSLL